MDGDNQDSDIVRYVRKHGTELIGLRYFAEIVDLADQIQDIPENQVKLRAQLRKNLLLVEAQVAVWRGLLHRIEAEERPSHERG